MATGEMYRAKAAEMSEKASQERSTEIRAALKELSMAYLVLANHIDHNALYSAETHPAPPMLQQQQPPPKKGESKE